MFFFFRPLIDKVREFEAQLRFDSKDRIVIDFIGEFLTYDEISEMAAYGGFPVRYPNWRWGMEYEELSREPSAAVVVTIGDD